MFEEPKFTSSSGEDEGDFEENVAESAESTTGAFDDAEDVDGAEDVEDAEDGDDEDGDDEDAGTNRLRGGAAKAVLEHVAHMLVDDPDSVVVDVTEARGGLRFSVHVAQGDMGRIIGRRGRTAQAIRTLVRAAAASDGAEASVDIVD